jgi:nucleoside-diphosphate-sugar epimerase
MNNPKCIIEGGSMAKTIFLAGASGAVGRHLAPLLITQGWRVVGTTRSKEKVPTLLNLGIEAAVVDVFDPEALTAAVVEAKPQVVIHQLTDLPPGLDPALMAEATMRNARIRDEGTRNLVSAAIQAGVERFIAQSFLSRMQREHCHTRRPILWP